MCTLCKLGHVTLHGQKMLENFPPKMGTILILIVIYPYWYQTGKKGQNNISVLGNQLLNFSIVSGLKQNQCFVLMSSPPIKNRRCFRTLNLSYLKFRKESQKDNCEDWSKNVIGHVFTPFHVVWSVLAVVLLTLSILTDHNLVLFNAEQDWSLPVFAVIFKP